jgi:thioredoxin-related protein
MAGDLAQTAAQARRLRVPVLIAFTQHSCPYCAVAKRDYLVPLQQSPIWRRRVLIREVDIDQQIPMRDFGGETGTTRAFAQRFEVKKVPTVIVFDADGRVVSPPIVGLLTRDFYGLYLEQAIEAGLVAMRKP